MCAVTGLRAVPSATSVAQPARVAQMVMADGLLLLSDIDGLYTADPRTDPGARHVPEVDRVTQAGLAMAGGSRSVDGSGGLAS
jgi:glutamate 5-kinase